MEEIISQMKLFLKSFNEQIQSPTSEELPSVRVANYTLDLEEIPGQVIDWILNYLDNCKSECPYPLALTIAKEAAHQVSASFAAVTCNASENEIEKYSSASNIYAEAIGKLSVICSSLLENNKFLDQINQNCFNADKYATSVFAIKNKRRKMEDRHVVHHDLNSLLDLKDVPQHSFYAVFDGHSGADAACYSSAQLHVNIAKHPQFLLDTPRAIIEGYQITDLNFLNKCNKGNIKSGCTVVSALLRENTLYLSWCGDSQAVLVKEGLPVVVTNPHKPDREDERARIESLGGHITHHGTLRVNGLLAVTRAIGDPDQKSFISSEPELTVINLDGTEDFLILACDGLWDGMAPDDVTAVLYRYLLDSSPNERLDSVAAKLVHQSKLQGSEDNITAIVIYLRDAEVIKENATKFMTNASLAVQGQDFLSMNGNTPSPSDVPFTKPTVLELSATSTKKLKNAANVMSSAGFGDASFSYQYVENSMTRSFQKTDTLFEENQNVLTSHQKVPASCVAPEATALSELPTPPIDDMLASQECDNFYATDLYKEINSMKAEENASVIDNIVDLNSNEPNLTGNQTSLLTEPGSDVSPEEAVGIASAVVSTTIETAVKCVAEDTVNAVPVQSPMKLNPYAKPFVMKSFFSSEDTSTTVTDNSVSVNLTEHSKDFNRQFETQNFNSEIVAENIQPVKNNETVEQFVDNLAFNNKADLEGTKDDFESSMHNVVIETAIHETLPPCEAVVHEPLPPHETAVHEPLPPHETAVPEASTPHETPVPEASTPYETPVPEVSTPHETPVPDASTQHETPVPDASTQHETPVPDASTQHETPVPDASTPHEMLVPEASTPHETLVPEASTPHETLVPEASTPQETLVPEASTPQETLVPEASTPQETLVPEASTPQETVVHKASTPQEMLVPEASTPQETLVPEASTPHETLVPKASTPHETPVHEASTLHMINIVSIKDSVPQDTLVTVASMGKESVCSNKNTEQDSAENLPDFASNKVMQNNVTNSNFVNTLTPQSSPEKIVTPVLENNLLIMNESDMISEASTLEDITSSLSHDFENLNINTSLNTASGNITDQVADNLSTPMLDQNIDIGFVSDVNENDVVEVTTPVATDSGELNLSEHKQNIEVYDVPPKVNANLESEMKVVSANKEAVPLLEKISKDPMSLVTITNELISTSTEMPSDPSVEDSHVEPVAVDLKSLPENIPEAEGVTEDVDSDSEKDGGWSYMKGNTLSGSKPRSTEKTSKTSKSATMKTAPSKIKKDVPKFNLDSRSKVKTSVTDKSKAAASTDKVTVSSVDKTKSLAASDKTKTATTTRVKTTAPNSRSGGVTTIKKTEVRVAKSSTLPATKVTTLKATHETNASTKKESSETNIRSTKPIRPTTLLRTTLLRTAKPAAPTMDKNAAPTMDKNAAPNRTRPTTSIHAKSKMATPSENKSDVKTSTPTTNVMRKLPTTQSKTTSTLRNVAVHKTVASGATTTVSRSTMQSKSAVTESKPKQPVGTLSKRPITSTAKKPDVKEVKDTVNKQISARKNVGTTKIESNSTTTSRRITTLNSRYTASKTSSNTAKLDLSKKDLPKAPSSKVAKSTSSKVIPNRSKAKGESALIKTDEVKNTLNLDVEQKNDSEIASVSEKYILETNNKEIVSNNKEKEDDSIENKEVTGSPSDVPEKFPVMEENLQVTKCTESSL